MYKKSTVTLIGRMTRLLNVLSTLLLLAALLYIQIGLESVMAMSMRVLLGGAIVVYLILGIDGGAGSRRLLTDAQEMIRELRQ